MNTGPTFTTLSHNKNGPRDGSCVSRLAPCSERDDLCMSPPVNPPGDVSGKFTAIARQLNADKLNESPVRQTKCRSGSVGKATNAKLKCHHSRSDDESGCDVVSKVMRHSDVASATVWSRKDICGAHVALDDIAYYMDGHTFVKSSVGSDPIMNPNLCLQFPGQANLSAIDAADVRSMCCKAHGKRVARPRRKRGEELLDSTTDESCRSDDAILSDTGRSQSSGNEASAVMTGQTSIHSSRQREGNREGTTFSLVKKKFCPEKLARKALPATDVCQAEPVHRLLDSSLTQDSELNALVLRPPTQNGMTLRSHSRINKGRTDDASISEGFFSDLTEKSLCASSQSNGRSSSVLMTAGRKKDVRKGRHFPTMNENLQMSMLCSNARSRDTRKPLK